MLDTQIFIPIVLSVPGHSCTVNEINIFQSSYNLFV